MNRIIFSVLVLSGMTVSAQVGKVGINTATPQATLSIEVDPANAASTATSNEGVLIPKLSKARIANIASPVDATMIYISDLTYTGTNPAVADITSKGFYYYDEDPVMPANSKWKKLNVNAGGNNLYNTDGSLSDNRTVNMNGKNLSFTGTGNVGIGTNAPAAKLHVKDGGVYAEDGVFISSRSTIDGGALSLRNPSKANSEASNWVLYNMRQGVYGDNSLQFWRYSSDGTKNAMAMTIADNGNVGIGTGTPGLKLHVQSSAEHKIRLQHEGSTDYTDLIKRSGGAFTIVNNVGGAWKGFFSIDNSGNVGLGTETPDRKLHVAGNARVDNLYTDSSVDSNYLHSRTGIYATSTVNTDHLHSRNGIYAVGHADVNTLNVRTSFSANALTGNAVTGGTVTATNYLKLPRTWEGGGDVCNASTVGAIRVRWIAINHNGIMLDNIPQICLKKNAANEYNWYTIQIGW